MQFRLNNNLYSGIGTKFCGQIAELLDITAADEYSTHYALRC